MHTYMLFPGKLLQCASTFPITSVARELVMEAKHIHGMDEVSLRKYLGLHIGGVMFAEYGADIKARTIFGLVALHVLYITSGDTSRRGTTTGCRVVGGSCCTSSACRTCVRTRPPP